MSAHKFWSDWPNKLGRWQLPALFGMCFIWLAMAAGLRSLMLPDEGRYVGVAWEMLSSGKLGVPLMDGMPYFHKPPLFYWLTVASLKMFGMNVWAARLAPIVAASGVAVGLYRFISRYVNRLTASVSLVVLLTQPFFFAGAQFANMDMLVAACISLSILSAADAVLRYESGVPDKTPLLMSYAYAALGLLAKGLIGIVLPGAVMFVWLLITRRWKSMLGLLSIPGILVLGIIGLPWFLLMQKEYPGFFDYFFIYHHFQRFSATGFNNQQPIWFYIPVLLGLTLPWSPWLWRTMNVFRNTEEPRQRDIRWLMLLWCLVILVFFSIPISKPVGYILPVLPALAFLIALPITRRIELRNQCNLPHHFVSHVLLSASICIAALVAVANHDYAISSYQLSSKIREVFSKHDHLVMVDNYQSDLPFYLGMTGGAWIVSDWDDESIEKHDNWRKELFDARKFNPEAGNETLLRPQQFNDRVCSESYSDSIWVWGNASSPSQLPILTNLPVFASRREQRVWHLTPETIRAYCKTPKSDLGHKSVLQP